MRNAETTESRAENIQVYPRGRGTLNPVDIRFMIPFNAAQAHQTSKYRRPMVSGFMQALGLDSRRSKRMVHVRPSGAEREMRHEEGIARGTPEWWRFIGYSSGVFGNIFGKG